MPNNLYLQQFKNILLENSQELTYNYHNLVKKIEDKKLPMIDIVFNEADIKQFENLAQKITQYKKIIALGVGGSSLGGKTLTSLKYQNKLQFIESIDPETIANILQDIDFENTFFLVISKSGETIETICQSLIILNILQKKQLKNFAQRFLFITENKNNSITKIAKKIGAEIFYHPQDIGGRFSCFSVVGMLPALICGVDIKKIRQGAKKILQDFMQNQNNNILSACNAQLKLFEQGFESNVVMPYIDSLKNFTDWYRQLWAESLGKNGFGSTPINSMGTIDQHSQLQLYLEGPHNKFFTFFTETNRQNDFDLEDIDGCKTLFGGRLLSDIVEVEQETTIEVLNQKKLPIRIFRIKSLDEEVLGGLMMQMFLETILIADCKNINPFDQPAVEFRKDLAKKILS